MATFERAVTTFTRGELSPRITPRVDFEGRFDGVEKLENFLVHVQGGAQKRSGTHFVTAAKTVDSRNRLIPFEFSVEQNYIIEATPNAFRFYANEGRLESGGSPVEVATPYVQLDKLKWTQSADVLFLAHPDTFPRELRRTSATSFALVAYSFFDGPYLDLNATSTTLTPDGTTGNVTVTASATTGINDGQGFLATDVGRLIRFQNPSNGLWRTLEITARNSATSVDADVLTGGADPLEAAASPNWRLGAWSDTTGWPEVVTFHQGRMWWGRTETQPQTLWATRVGRINNFAPSDGDGTVAADHAITITIDSNQVNAIAWLVSSHRGLHIGTVGEGWLLRSADDTSGISPTSAELVAQSNWGSDDEILPTKVGTSTINVQLGRTIVRESAFSFDEEVFTASNVTYLSEHLFRKGVKRLTFSQTPIQTVWALLEDGTLAGFTFDKEQKVLAWHHHTLFGASAQVVDIATIKHGAQDQLWLIVRRVIGGVEVHYVEFMEEPFDAQLHSIEDAFFVDSGLTGTFGTPQTVVSGLDHLEGQTVTVLADGATHPDKVVSGGSITLDRPASKVHVGKGFTAEIRTMPLEAPNREGSFVSLGKTKRMVQAHVMFLETVGASFGAANGELDTVQFRAPGMAMDEPVPLFDGIKSLSLTSAHDQQARVRVVSDQPLPCSVSAIVMEGVVYGS